jgi:hypothetical protein
MRPNEISDLPPALFFSRPENGGMPPIGSTPPSRENEEIMKKTKPTTKYIGTEVRLPASRDRRFELQITHCDYHASRMIATTTAKYKSFRQLHNTYINFLLDLIDLCDFRLNL